VSARNDRRAVTRCNALAVIDAAIELGAPVVWARRELGRRRPQGLTMARLGWTLAVMLGGSVVLSAGCGSDDGGLGAGDGGSGGTGTGTTGGNSMMTGGAMNGGNTGAGGNTTGGGGTTGGAGNTGAVDADGGATGTGNDPGAAAGVVTCGTTSCNTPQICCVSFLGGMNGGFECKAQADCSGPTSAPGTCDGKEDCGAGEACCAKFSALGGSGAFCKPMCDTDAQALCHTDTDCGQGETCIPCAPPTGGIVSLVYHLCSATPECPSPYTKP